jgi:hypothetical protein
MPDSIVSSHPISLRLNAELLILMNCIWMPREVWWSVDGGLCLPAQSFYHCDLKVVHFYDLIWHVQVVHWLFPTTICPQIYCMYTYSET